MVRQPEISGASVPWRIGWYDWVRIYARAMKGAMRDDYGIIASSIAFAAFLSFLPLLGFVALMYGMVVSNETVVANITTLTNLLPNNSQQLVGTWLTNSLARHGTDPLALLLSAIVTLFGTWRAGRSVLYGINVANGIEQTRGPLRHQLVAMIVVLASAALLLVALVSISVLAFVEHVLPDRLPGASAVLELLLWGSLTLGPAIALVLIYRYAAARDPVPWRWAWPGAATGLLLWLGATSAFRLYVNWFASYATTYGSLAAVVVLLLWLMLSAWILLLGAKVNAEALRTAGLTGPGKEAV